MVRLIPRHVSRHEQLLLLLLQLLLQLRVLLRVLMRRVLMLTVLGVRIEGLVVRGQQRRVGLARRERRGACCRREGSAGPGERLRPGLRRPARE